MSFKRVVAKLLNWRSNSLTSSLRDLGKRSGEQKESGPGGLYSRTGREVPADVIDAVSWECPHCHAANFDDVVMVKHVRGRANVACINCERVSVLAVSVSVHALIEQPKSDNASGR